MYGKLFASTYTGSMVGSGTDVFAVWGYVVANAVKSQVEMNPDILAVTFGCTRERVEAAIERLCDADPRSRSKISDGRRLVREGQFAYRVVNHATYNGIRNEADRREYNRIKQAQSRARKKAGPLPGAIDIGDKRFSAAVNLEQVRQQSAIQMRGHNIEQGTLGWECVTCGDEATHPSRRAAELACLARWESERAQEAAK